MLTFFLAIPVSGVQKSQSGEDERGSRLGVFSDVQMPLLLREDAEQPPHPPAPAPGKVF